jgi:diguanylate cyclase (GGDEF)-like protein
MPQSILVIEDNAITRKLVRIALTAAGFDVLEAETGYEGLDLAPRADLVLQDMVLCDIDGFDLVGRLRRRTRTPGIPVIAFTGLAAHDRIRAAGFQGLIAKPVEPDALVAAVRRHLGGEDLAHPMDAPATLADRGAAATSAMLARLGALAAESYAVDAVVADVLASFLNASGLPIGVAYTVDARGQAHSRVQIGLAPSAAGSLAVLAEHARTDTAEPFQVSERTGSESERAVVAAAGLASILVVPLRCGGRRVGGLVVGSTDPDVPSDWIQLSRLMAGPIAQALALAGTVARLAASEQRFRGIAESTADGIVVADAAGRIVYANPAAIAVVGRGGLDDRAVDDVLPIACTGSGQGNLTRDDGSIVPVSVTSHAFEDPPGLANRVHVVHDLSARLRLQEFADLANRDPLTGLYNRRRFEEELATRLADARRHGTQGAVLLLDLDRFKPINDTHGHAAGDLVLRAVADLLRGHTRETDLVCRLGGDEFVALLARTDVAGARACGAKLIDRICALRIDLGGTTVSVGASVGVASFPGRRTTPAAVVAAADAALYRIKRRGRGAVTAWPETEPVGAPPCLQEPVDAGQVCERHEADGCG